MDQRANFLALILLDALEDENEADVYKILDRNNINPSFVPCERGIAPIHFSCGMENVSLARDITRRFLEKGADPNVLSSENMTPLHVAAIYGRVEIVRMLLQHGAKLDIIDDDRKTPVHYAIEECHFDIVQCMRDHVFEDKFEQKKQSQKVQPQENAATKSKILLNKTPLDTVKDGQKVSTPVNKNLTGVSMTFEGTNGSKYTPNQIHYNYDVTSPYYINITHRRNKPQPKFPATPNNTTIETQFESNTSEVTQPINIFSLTKENLEELSLKQKGTEADRSRLSMIDLWREKVQRSRKRQSILKEFNDIEEMVDNVMENDDLNFTNTVLNEKNGDSCEECLNCDGNKTCSDNSSKQNRINQKRTTLSLGSLIQRVAQAHSANLEPEPNPNIIIEVTDTSYKTAPEIADDNKENEKNDTQTRNDTNFICSPSTCEYFLQMTEAYVHTDDEKGLVFYETKLLSNQGNKIAHLRSTENDSNKAVQEKTPIGKKFDPNVTQTTQSSNLTVPIDYETDALRAELTSYGEMPGPITKSTKRLYIKRLIKYKRKKAIMLELKKDKKGTDFSVELFRTLLSIENFKRIENYLTYEKQSMMYFAAHKNPKQLREGHLKQSFIYLLIDPRISCNLPGESAFIDSFEVWKRFLHSIFYVGKGKTSRPYAHLYEAMKTHSRTHGTEQTSPVIKKSHKMSMKKTPINKELFKSSAKTQTDSQKIQRILDIWSQGSGVVCLHVFHNILPIEAYTREAAIIDALSIQHLTNIKRGNYYGPAQTWTMKEKKYLGIALLYKAMHIYLSEGESQLSPSDLI